MTGASDNLPPDVPGPVHAATYVAVSVPGRRPRFALVLACGAEPEDVLAGAGDWVVEPVAGDPDVDCDDCRVEMELDA